MKEKIVFAAVLFAAQIAWCCQEQSKILANIHCCADVYHVNVEDKLTLRDSFFTKLIIEGKGKLRLVGVKAEILEYNGDCVEIQLDDSVSIPRVIKRRSLISCSRWNKIIQSLDIL